MYRQITYFEGLNALRFFAAFLVLIHHGETVRKKYATIDFEWLSLFKNGGIAVEFFFVLSGFLITYILLKERYETGTTSIRRFYLKRVLRIWPLYFLVILLVTLVLPIVLPWLGISFKLPYTLGETWYYFFFFVPGLVTLAYGSHLLEPTWSIGVEELFYVIWAPVFKAIQKNMLGVLLAIILLKAVFHFSALYWFNNEVLRYLVRILRFEDMAVGGLGAYFVFWRKTPLSEIGLYKKPVQRMVYLVLGIYLVFNINIDHPIWNAIFKTPVISSLLLDTIFLYIIIGVALVEQSILKCRNRILYGLGEISYGIYMYHLIILFLMMLPLKAHLPNLHPLLNILLFYGLLLCSVIVVAIVSKEYFENIFLKLKSKLL